LPAGTDPLDKLIPHADVLTAGRLRELAELSDGEGITHESPEDLFAIRYPRFREMPR
jgi:hypothetical protein